MTRTRDNTGGPKPNNLQPTKFPSRRGDTLAVKVDDLAPNNSIRDILSSVSRTDYPSRFMKSKSTSESSVKPGEDAVKVGLGPVLFNLKPHHFHSDKKPLSSEEYNKKVMNFYLEKKASLQKQVSEKENVVNEAVDATPPLCKGISKLKLFEEPHEEKSKTTSDDSGMEGGAVQKAFKKLVSLKMVYDSGQEISVKLDKDTTKTFVKPCSAVRKAGVRNWKSPETATEIHNGTLKNLFSWALPTSTRWKELEDRMTKWSMMSKEAGAGKQIATLPTEEELADQLNISLDQLRSFEFHKDLKKVVDSLKNHICHSSLPWLSALMAVSDLQQGDLKSATKNASDSQGTFLHSEIVDKHICYISRNEESNVPQGQRTSFSKKAELFRKQIQDTLEFGTGGVGARTEKSDDAFTKAISSFNPDWNIIQITAFLHSKNRFGLDQYGRRQIPQLLLSALAHLPNEKERSCFTTFCRDPPVQEGSMMRLGLMEEFQKILDRNLFISDDSIVISRRNYWEERNKHNLAMMSVIDAMEEDWIGPWNFLFPGHTTRADLKDKILSEVITPTAKKYNLNSAQKLVLYKLTENFAYLHPTVSSSLETVLSFILNLSSENGLGALCKKIMDIGKEVPAGDRYPTILVVDQDLEIYPWESMGCLSNTDVSRMPSLNMIRSNYNFVSSLRPTYPDIVDGSSCTFVLNPDGTLLKTQERLEQYFRDHKTWKPVIARPPATKEVQECLENQHIFLYNGHGAGSNFYPDYAVQKLVCQAVPLLMGCGSAQAHYAVPRIYGSHTIHSYFLAGCPSVVGYLWEITDAECDRITVDLVERWLPDKSIMIPRIPFFDPNEKREREKSLSRAMRLSRNAATQFLTRCGIVCYGLPVNTQD